MSDHQIQHVLANFDSLPDSAFVRLPVVAAWKSIGQATVWRWVKSGILPEPHKIGPNTTAWNVGELRRRDKPKSVEPQSPAKPKR